jgi:hypothetical protein
MYVCPARFGLKTELPRSPPIENLSLYRDCSKDEAPGVESFEMESFRRRPDAEQIEPLLGSKSEDSAKELRLAPWRRSTIAILLVVILAAVDSGLLEIVVPLIRVYEGIVCHNHFMIHDPGVIVPGTDLPEEMCKIEPVQSQLAFIRGYEAFFMTVPSE